MLCCLCKEKEATVHLIEIECGNPETRRKLDLCEQCAKAKGVNDPTGFSLADLFASLWSRKRKTRRGSHEPGQ
jgi:protein arginine kinase activator